MSRRRGAPFGEPAARPGRAEVACSGVPHRVAQRPPCKHRVVGTMIPHAAIKSFETVELYRDVHRIGTFSELNCAVQRYFCRGAPCMGAVTSRAYGGICDVEYSAFEKT